MNDGGNQTERLLEVTNAFADTSVLLNYALKGIERDTTSELIDGDWIDIVTGVTVVEELDIVYQRRKHIYEDFLDFVIESDGELGEYTPESRRPYFQENDLTHVRNLQMRLSQLDSRAEILRQLRRTIRSIERRLDYLRNEYLPSATFDQQPGIGLLIALSRAIENDKDRNVVADAALWAAEGTEASGVFVSQDKEDLVSQCDSINEVLHEERDAKWMLQFVFPSSLLHARLTELEGE